MRVFAIVTDAFGGRGGIACYNRHVLRAFSESPLVTQVTAMPRLVVDPVGVLPLKLRFPITSASGKWHFVCSALRHLFRPADVVFCGHINLLPLGVFMALLWRAPLILQVHGIDAWVAPKPLVKRLIRHVSEIWSVSRHTRDRMNVWAGLPESRYRVIPNTIALSDFSPDASPEPFPVLMELEHARVMLTLARLDARERYKGIDELLEALPGLLADVPELVYVIAGEGDDSLRLAAKAQALGVGDQVRFIGYVSEHEKLSWLRRADVFAMPGRGEGFGIVYLEAMACGTPVIGSVLDGSRDALLDGELGQLVNPDDRRQLHDAVLAALSLGKRRPPGLEVFDWPCFRERVHDALERFA